MPAGDDTLDLHRLQLSSGQARKLDLEVSLDPLQFGGEKYEVVPPTVPVIFDVSRTSGSGWAMRIRLHVDLAGPCMRCLAPAHPGFDVDSREIEQPGNGDELSSPYVDDGVLDLGAWARDALVLALPAQITCRPDCLGLCAQCGENLNDSPGHAHERGPDPRWAKLSEIKLDP